MPHAAPIPALPAIVSPLATQKADVHGNAPAERLAFSSVFREHAAPHLEVDEARLPIAGSVTEGPLPATEDAIPERGLTEEHSPEGQRSPETSISVDSSQFRSPVQLHVTASDRSIKGEISAIPSHVDDTAPRPLSASKASGTGSSSSTIKESKTKSDQTRTSSVATIAPMSPSMQMIPQAVHPAVPAALSPEPIHPPAGFAEDQVQPLKTQSANAESTTEEKNDMPFETQTMPDQALAIASHSSGNETTSASSVSPSMKLTPALAEVAPLKGPQQAPIPTPNPATPHRGHTAPEQGSIETISPVNTGTGAITSHSALPESSLSPSQPIGQTPAVITAPAGSSNPTPDLYDRMDQGVAPATLHSGAQHVVVGVHDPSLGWLEIKTQNVAGHIDATLVTTSAQAHASLTGQLPSIAEYLEQRDLSIGTLAVQHHMSGANGGGGSASGSHSSGNNAQNSNHSGPGHREEAAAPPSMPDLRPRDPAPKAAGENYRAFQPVSYISVRA